MQIHDKHINCVFYVYCYFLYFCVFILFILLSSHDLGVFEMVPHIVC